MHVRKWQSQVSFSDQYVSGFSYHRFSQRRRRTNLKLPYSPQVPLCRIYLTFLKIRAYLN